MTIPTGTEAYSKRPGSIIHRMTDFSAIVKQLETERNQIDAAIKALQGLRSTSPTSSEKQPKRKTMSASARKRISAAQKARWAKVKAGNK